MTVLHSKAQSGYDRPRLLIVVNVTWFFLSHRLPIAVAAKNAGYDVTIAAGGSSEAERQRIVSLGLRFEPLSLERSGRSPTENLRLLISLYMLYRRVRPDIVHHVTIKPVMFGTLAARFAGVPAVVNAISGLGYVFAGKSGKQRALRSLVSYLYRLCLGHPNGHFIFQNHDDQKEFSRIVPIDANRHTLIRGSGVDLDEFVYVEPNLNQSPVRIVLVARMLRDKGIAEFCKAIQSLATSGLDVSGELAGMIDLDNPASFSESSIRDLERTTGVRWLGNVRDIRTLLADAAIICLPSYREGLPKALAEAAAVGRPIVTTDVPGCRDVVDDGINGFLVPPQQVQPIVDALSKLVLDSALRERFGRAAREKAQTQLSLDMVVAQTLEVYKKLA